MLHVTSGDTAADSIRRALLGGIVLPWHDVLHEGPVPMGLRGEALRRERAAFLASLSHGDAQRIERLLQQRDEVLASFALHDEVVFWFEPDLFDQLQLLQVLEHFAAAERGEVLLTLVETAPADAAAPTGLADLEPPQVAARFADRMLVSEEQIELAAFAWQAFRAPDPTLIERLRGMDLSALPHLSSAFLRHLEQFPSTRSGLGRTERCVLHALSAGARTEADLYRLQAEQEERPYIGRTVFRWYLDLLAAGEQPAIAIDSAAGDESALFRLTERGHHYADGSADFVAENGIDRWWGGVHQHGRSARWRWNETKGHLHSDAR